MVEPIKLKPKADYSEHTIVKIIDGKPVEYVNIDAMTEEQFKKYCQDTGSEWFQRFSVNMG